MDPILDVSLELEAAASMGAKENTLVGCLKRSVLVFFGED